MKEQKTQTYLLIAMILNVTAMGLAIMSIFV